MKLLSTLLVTMTLALCGPVLAQPMPGGPGMGGPGGTGGTSQQQRQQIQQMQSQLAEEQAELKRISDELYKDFQKKPEWQAANAANEKAKADHETARNTVLTKVYETPEYKAALQSKFDAETALENLAGTDAAPEQIQEASDAVMESNSAVRKMEDDALSADQAVTDTRKTLTEASQAMTVLDKEFKQSLELNERYLNQSDIVQNQKDKLAEAKQRLADANRNKQRSNRNTPNNNRRNNRNNKGGGGMPGMGGGGY
jgi:delta 1-pyrroline-5-carboxylate dehydrogenase